MAKWIIRGESERDAVDALITNTGLSRDKFAEKSGVSTNTIRRLLDREPKADASMKALFGYLSFQKTSGLTQAELKTVTATIKLYCDEDRKPAGKMGEHSMKTVSEAASSLAVMAVYVKFLHLRDRRQEKPVYRKFIARLGQEVEVFDEFIIVRTLQFSATPEPFDMVGHTKGITDLQPAYPPSLELNPLYIGKHDAPDSVGHFEAEPEPLAQGAFTIVNGFQHGNEVIASLVTENCARLVLIVDMSSLPGCCAAFLAADPLGYHVRKVAKGVDRLPMQVQESDMGGFILDTAELYKSADGEPGWDPAQHKLLKNDRCEIRFAVNWNALI